MLQKQTIFLPRQGIKLMWIKHTLLPFMVKPRSYHSVLSEAIRWFPPCVGCAAQVWITSPMLSLYTSEKRVTFSLNHQLWTKCFIIYSTLYISTEFTITIQTVCFDISSIMPLMASISKILPVWVSISHAKNSQADSSIQNSMGVV